MGPKIVDLSIITNRIPAFMTNEITEPSTDESLQDKYEVYIGSVELTEINNFGIKCVVALRIQDCTEETQEKIQLLLFATTTDRYNHVLKQCSDQDPETFRVVGAGLSRIRDKVISWYGDAFHYGSIPPEIEVLCLQALKDCIDAESLTTTDSKGETDPKYWNSYWREESKSQS